MIVIDASVATKLINTQEEGNDLAEKLLSAHTKNEEKIIVPAFLFLEVANALATKSTIREEYIQKGMHLLYKADFFIEEITEKLILEASMQAKKYKTTVYDMVYAVIAKKNNAILITADEKFVQKVSLPYVKSLRQF